MRSESAKEDTEKGIRRKKREEETDLQRLEHFWRTYLKDESLLRRCKNSTFCKNRGNRKATWIGSHPSIHSFLHTFLFCRLCSLSTISFLSCPIVVFYYPRFFLWSFPSCFKSFLLELVCWLQISLAFLHLIYPFIPEGYLCWV